MEFNNDEFKNDNQESNKISNSKLDVSGGRIIETGEGDNKEYFFIPDHIKSFKTKEEAEKAEQIYKYISWFGEHPRHRPHGFQHGAPHGFHHHRPLSPEDIKKRTETMKETLSKISKPMDPIPPTNITNRNS